MRLRIEREEFDDNRPVIGHQYRVKNAETGEELDGVFEVTWVAKVDEVAHVVIKLYANAVVDTV